MKIILQLNGNLIVHILEIQHRSMMKIKAREGKLNNFNAMNVPCSSVHFSELRDGKEIDIKEDICI